MAILYKFGGSDMRQRRLEKLVEKEANIHLEWLSTVLEKRTPPAEMILELVGRHFFPEGLFPILRKFSTMTDDVVWKKWTHN
jgi:hypothetical protein